MGDLMLSSYSGSDRVSDLKEDMITEDGNGTSWSLILDEDWGLEDILKLLNKDEDDAHVDYENLENIIVTSPGPSDCEDFNGCLADRMNSRSQKIMLIYAPFPLFNDIKKEIRKTVNKEIGIVSNHPFSKITDVWNGIYSKAIRANIREFSKGSYYGAKNRYKRAFETLLWKYVNNLYALSIWSLGMDISSGVKYIELKRVILSDELFYMEYVKGEPPIRKPIAPEEIEKIVDIDNIDPDETPRSLVLGEYYAHGVDNCPDPHPEIVLYVEAMKRYAGIKGRDIEDLFLSVFIHEFFHAVHHAYCMKFGPAGEAAFCDKKNNIIVESLAAAYEYYFCENILHNDDLKDDLMKTWNKYKPTSFPYSGAKDIVKCTALKKIADLEKMIKGYPDIEPLFDDIMKHRNKVAKTTKPYLLCLRSYFVLSLLFMKEAQDELVK